jgi:hypothetical protein
MEPITMGIIAGANLLGQLGSSLFGASQQRAQQKAQAEQQLGQNLMSAAEQEVQQKQQGIANLIAAYRSALGGQ